MTLNRLSSLFVVVIMGIWLSGISGSSTINTPVNQPVHENDDDVLTVWNDIGAMCYVTYDCSYICTDFVCCDCDTGCEFFGSTCTRTCDYTDSCDVCEVTSSGNLFEVNGNTVRKIECTDRGCGPTCSASGCVNAGESYTVTVTCRETSGTFIDDGEISATFQVKITANAPPVFSFSEGDSIKVSQDQPVNDVINTVLYSDSDLGVGNDYIRYKLNSGPEQSYIHQNTLFGLNTANGEIYITQGLEKEFSYDYTMELCIYDRRSDDVCDTLSIRLVACYQTPNCSDHPLSIADTFGISPHSSTDSLYTVTSPDPGDHFTDFRTTWAQLSWNYVENELEDETSLDESTGVITVVQNISIHPAWPSQTFKQVISVSNSESCYITSCTLTITVDYTNWPIEIRNLPNSNNVSEDIEGDVDVLVLDIYDYNYENEDNVTCEITNISPYEANLFELRNDSLFSRTSYTLTKLACQTPGCGYKNESYLCNQNIGCLNYDKVSQYEVTIRCWDAYGSEDQGVFTLYVVENEAPQYVNLPNTVILDTSEVASLETVFSVVYTDNEDESLIYEYIFADIEEPYEDPKYFIASPTGDFADNLANITTTVYLHDKPVNKTYFIQICGHERRNEICANLTVKLQEYCSPTPDCADKNITINETEPDDVLFDIAQLVYEASNYTSSKLSYTISSRYPNTFTVDESTGIVTKNGALETVYPSTTYTLQAFVSEPDTCSYGHCLLTVTVKYVNEPLYITNLPENVSIHEDDTSIDTVIAIGTSDANVDDTVTCIIENYVEPFYITETISGSQEFLIKKRANAVLSSATTTYIVTVNCSDAHGSSDTGNLTITVELNQSPALVNLENTTSITVNPYDYSKGDSIYTVSATDPENDELAFNCSVENSMVPLRCHSTESTTVDVELRRNVDGVEENGFSYSIDICVSDPKQYEYPCGSLNITFTSDKTRPEVTNLPDTLSFPENTTVGTVLFSANVLDPDVGENHMFTMTVIPRDEQSILYLNSNGDLILLNNFDYEKVTNYQLSISVRDDYLEGNETKVLTINIDNVNEPNTVEATTTTITFQETTEVNSVLEDLGLTCTDEDEGDTLTYNMQAVYDHFSINSTTGELTLIKVWDLESDPVLPSTTTVIITCTDAGGLSSSVVVIVNIEAVNEYPPQIQVLAGDLSQAIQVNSTTDPATTFFTFQVTDEDYNDDGIFECSILGNGLGSRHFRIVQTTDTNGVAVFNHRPTGYFFFNNDKTFQFTILVCDGEEYPLCSHLTVNVTYTTSDPDVKTKPEKKCLTCHSNGKALVACVVIECLIIIGFIAHCCKRMVFSTNKTEGQIDLIKQNLSRSRQGSSSSHHSRAPGGRRAPNERFNRRRPGSERSIATARGVRLTTINTIPRPDNHSIDLSSGSSDDDSDYDTTEFRKRTQSVSSRLSVLTTSNKVHPSKIRNRTSSIGSRESNLSEGAPGKMFRARVSAFDTGLPQPVYSSEVNADMDGNTLDY